MGQNKGIGKEGAFVKIIYGILIALTAICILLAFAGSYTQPRIWPSIVVVFIGFITFTGILLYISKKTENTYLLMLSIIFFVALALRILFLHIWPIVPTSDFADTYEAAKQLAQVPLESYRDVIKESYSYYYTTWSMHVPFILLKTGIVKLFGSGYYALQVIFSIFSALSCALTAAIGRHMFGKRVGVVAGAIMALLPLHLLFSGVLSNQHIATFFFLLAIYFLVADSSRKRIYSIILAAVSACISQLIRPEMLIFVIAVLCYFFYTEIITKNTVWLERVKHFLLYGIMFAGVYFLLLSSANFSLLQSGIIASPITSTSIEYKVATGLNAETLGTWSEADFALANNPEALRKLIAERVENPLQVASLMVQKLVYQFGTYNYFWCVQDKPQEFVNNWYSALTTELMHLVFWLCMVSIWFCCFGKAKNRKQVLLFITLIGYFMTFAVIEVQNRYNYAFIPIFVLFASAAAVYASDWTVQRVKQNRG